MGYAHVMLRVPQHDKRIIPLHDSTQTCWEVRPSPCQSEGLEDTATIEKGLPLPRIHEHKGIVIESFKFLAKNKGYGF